MTYVVKPKFHHPELPKNKLGYTHRDYEGKISTLCAGCGHDSITASIIEACFELSIEPHRVAKISGIGCSSKTPDYFLGNSHGFNSVHGRMPSVLTGANLANRDLIYLGVSGDGDSASIGLGQFAHAMRRGVNMVYIVENNGVYGLTKGQFSATADRGSKSKRGLTNTDSAIDMVGIALQLGASFVARSFSGDKRQLVPIIKAAIEHREAIQKTNPGVNLPHQAIAFIRRAESSGTTFVFTTHLNAVDSRWRADNGGPGVSKTPQWKVGIGGKGNAGVAALIDQTPGALGYVETGYAELTHLPMAAVENRAGAYVEPTIETGQAALAGEKLPGNFRLFIPDPKGKAAYPITGQDLVNNITILEAIIESAAKDGAVVTL